MHFWVCKRTAQHSWSPHVPHVSSAAWSPRPPPKRTDSPMPAPVHRYPPVPTAQRETSRRLAEHRQPSAHGESSRHQLAARATSNIEAVTSSDPGMSDADAEVLMADDIDCDPARKCQSCCCIIVVTILVIFTLSLAKMYIGHDVADEQNELTGIIFLVLLLFFVCLLLLFVRFSVLLLKRRVRDGSSIRSSHSGACGGAESGMLRHEAVLAPPVAAPPPYHEALLLPAPLAESPPPAYDKLPELIRGNRQAR